MDRGAYFLFIILVVLVQYSRAWAPHPRVTRDFATATAKPLSTRGLITDGLSMQLGSAHEKYKAAKSPKEQPSSVPSASRNRTKQPTNPPMLVPKPSRSFPWMNGKPNEIRGSHLELGDVDEQNAFSPELFVAGTVAGVSAIVATISAANFFDLSVMDMVDGISNALQHPSATLDQIVQTVESMGPLGAIYFGVAYTIAEILAIPAIPLAASAGYIFGPFEGTAVVLVSASVAAAISFLIGRTLLRDYVEKVLEEYPKFSKLDKAIGKEGFKLMLVLRLSPIFPFALSNYLYGASSINFPAFFWGTLLGFAPGTIAYVCTGAFGKALQFEEGNTYPWYVYAGGLACLGGFIKVLADTAIKVVEEMEDE